MENEVRFLYLDDIIPNRFQPRENFDEQALKELAVSIKEHGVIQPIVVRQIGDKYEIIAGERRYKASTMAGLTKVPAIIKNLDDKESSKVALIENLQRKDLTPIEEARTYQKILELDALTQEELARTMGKSQSAVSNKLRLLALTDEVQDALLHEQISERHARSLLNVSDKQKQVELLNKVINSRMTVRELDQAIKQLNGEILEEDNDEKKTMINEKVENLNSMMNYGGDTTSIDNQFVQKTEEKNESVDIKSDRPQSFDISNLLNPVGNNSNLSEFEKPNIEVLDSVSESKEEIIGGSGLLAGMTVDNSLLKQKNEEVKQDSGKDVFSNSLYQNFNEQSIDTPVDNDFIENIDINNNSNDDSNNSTSTIESVKQAIKNVKGNNKNIEMEEFDFDDFYQIVIRIDKK